MSENDLVLLDSSIDRWKEAAPEGLADDRLFELFALEQVLKDYDLATGEVMAGQTGGGNDGGLDGFFTFLNRELCDEDTDFPAVKGEARLDVYMVQARRTPSFQESVFNTVMASAADLFNLGKDADELGTLYSKHVLGRVMVFRGALLALAGRHPTIDVHFVLATRGSTANIDKKVYQKAEYLKKLIEDQFSSSSCDVRFLGARELLEDARREPRYTLNLDFIESPISMHDSYIVLVNLKKYYDFITDETGALRKYIFEWNVRDDQGPVEVNVDIRKTLKEEGGPEFWWLNNGVTILASKASITGKTIALDNVQIVNGLQTSVSIYEHIAANPPQEEERSLLCRIIKTGDDKTRDRVIKATNFQTAVAAASLKATDRIQRDIEAYFVSQQWYYDRRKNYYKNLGRPADRIISIPYLAQAMMAMGLSRPDDSRARPTSLIKNDDDYRCVFDESVSFSVYLWSAKTMKRVESFVRSLDPGAQDVVWELRFHLAMMAATNAAGERIYHPKQLGKLVDVEFDDAALTTALNELIRGSNELMKKSPRPLDRIAKSRDLVEHLLTTKSGSPTH